MENTYLVWIDGGTECVLIDPGLQPKKILNALTQLKLSPALILLTHGHADHIGGNWELKRHWPSLPIVIGVGDAPMLSDPMANLSGLTGSSVTSPPADQLVRDQERFSALGLNWLVREIPGHSPGHVVYILEELSTPVVFGGDVLFESSIGRTDFPGGNLQLLLSGIREKLFCLPEQTIVYPGHGGTTTIGIEQKTNPYCRIQGNE